MHTAQLACKSADREFTFGLEPRDPAYSLLVKAILLFRLWVAFGCHAAFRSSKSERLTRGNIIL